MNSFQTMATTPRTFPQMDLIDVQNKKVNVDSLASSHHLILITLKNVTCPICPQLLKILNICGLESDTNRFSDPFTLQEWEIDNIRKRFFRLLLKFDAYFIILCPGTNTQVSNVQQNIPFLDYPFIAGEQANELAKVLDVQLSNQEFMPAILEISKGTLSVYPIYIGRAPGHYFHQVLLKRLMQERCMLEMKGIIQLRDINEVINQLKRRIIKCQDGNMVTTSLLSTPPTRPLPATNMTNTATEKKQIKKRLSSLNDLPLELLEIIFSSYCDDIYSLIKTSGTCRIFYIAVCNVMILCLRNQMTYLKPALPQENGKVIWDEAKVTDPSLDRWSDNEDGIPCRELQYRLSIAKELLVNIGNWTRHWGPKPSNSSNNSM